MRRRSAIHTPTSNVPAAISAPPAGSVLSSAPVLGVVAAPAPLVVSPDVDAADTPPVAPPTPLFGAPALPDEAGEPLVPALPADAAEPLVPALPDDAAEPLVPALPD